ncbi:hypothetical protein [Aliikangiella maris]|uniref:Uncharacterized protein n=2 Tax=Aliikangiella maris TaxID=3162458 RepID=A0ABV3MU00_9GAMM
MKKETINTQPNRQSQIELQSQNNLQNRLELQNRQYYQTLIYSRNIAGIFKLYLGCLLKLFLCQSATEGGLCSIKFDLSIFVLSMVTRKPI